MFLSISCCRRTSLDLCKLGWCVALIADLFSISGKNAACGCAVNIRMINLRHSHGGSRFIIVLTTAELLPYR